MSNGQKIYEMFMAGDITPLQAAHGIVFELAKDFDEDARHLNDAQKEMLKFWEGDAADAAGRGAEPLILANSDSVPMIIDAGGSVQHQVDVYSWGKHSVEPVPDEPSEPSPFARGVAILSPPPDPQGSYREGMARHTSANDNNVRVMEQYANVTGDNRAAFLRTTASSKTTGADFHRRDPRRALPGVRA